MKTSEDISEFATAFCKAQSEMGGAAKDSANPFFKSKFADLASVIDAIRSPFASNGLCFIQGTSYADGAVTVTTRLIHASGQWIESSLSAPVTKLDPQGVGSAITYAKRYSLQSMVGVPSVDDDGESAMVRDDFITPDQVSQIKAGLSAYGGYESAFLKHYKLQKVGDIKQSQFDAIAKVIQNKAAKAAEAEI